MNALLQVGCKFSSLLANGWWEDFGQELLNVILQPIAKIFWTLCSIFFIVLDMFETLFQRFAGISTVEVAGEKVEGDIVLYLIQSDLVIQIFLSVLILSLFLLIMFTIFAIVKNQYAEKQEPVSKIISSSFKGLLMYLLVPVATLVCLMVGNVVLVAVNEATAVGISGTNTTSGLLFKAAAYDANKVRKGTLQDRRKDLGDEYQSLVTMGFSSDLSAIGINSQDDCARATSTQLDQVARLIDNDVITSIIGLGMGDRALQIADTALGALAGAASGGNPAVVTAALFGGEFAAVSEFYDVLSFSFITIWVGGAFLIGTIGKITWGLVSRLFKMTIYFAISPAVMATFPIDNGKALGAWRGEMVKQGTMAFVAVGVTNVLYSILPFFGEVDIFPGGVAIASSIAQLFIWIIAFKGAGDLIGAVSGWFGAGDAFAEGKKAKESLGLPKLGTVAGTAIGVYAGVKGAKKAMEGKNLTRKDKFKAYAAGAFGGTKWGGQVFGDDMAKKQKAGEEAAKRATTTKFGGEKDKAKESAWNRAEQNEKNKKKFQAIAGEDFYNQDKDDGTNTTQMQYRKFWKDNGTAGAALTEQQRLALEAEEKAAQELDKYTKQLDGLARAVANQSEKEADLKRIYEKLGYKNWNPEKGMHVLEHVALTGENAKGERVANVSYISGELDKYKAASKELKDVQYSLDTLQHSDAKFKEYIGSGGKGEELYNNASSGKIEKIHSAINDVQARLQKVVEGKLDLEKEMAAHNQRQSYNNLTDEQKKIVEAYEKSHPKSE